VRDIHRHKHSRDGSPMGLMSPRVEHFEKHDPSEAIGCGELVSTLKMYFDIVAMRPRGPAHIA
jgi:hypothetical protein